MVVLKRYPNSMSANIAKSILEDSGINAFVADETLANADPPVVFASGGLRLMVAEEDYERAAKVLVAREQGLELSDDFDPGEAEHSGPTKKYSASSQTVAPGSLLMGSNGMSSLVTIAISLLAGAILMFLYLKFSHSHLAYEPGTAYDTNDDGRTDQLFNYAFDDGSYEFQSDDNFDGEMDSVYRYNKHGGFISGRRDRNFDGRFETQIQSKGRNQIQEVDRDGNGDVDMIETIRNNNYASAEWLREGKVWKKSTYDPFQKVRDEIDQNGDGTFDTTVNFGEGEEPD